MKFYSFSFLLICILLISCSKKEDDLPLIDETNTPPVITFISPKEGSTFAPGDEITVSISASASSNITLVDFIIQGQSKGYLETPPFNYIWDTTGEQEGTYEITVEVTDENNLTTKQSININIAKPQYSISFDGIIKCRQNNILLPEITVLLEDKFVSSNSNGEYNIETQFNENTSALRIESNDSYIGTNYGFDLSDNKKETVNLYLYKKQTSINKKTNNFIKGVSLFDAGPWMGQDLFPNAFNSTFSRLSNMNANLFTVFDPVFIQAVGDDSVKMSSTANTQFEWNMLSASQYEILTDLAADKNLNYMYWFGVWPQDEEQLSGKSFNSIVFGNSILSDRFWEDWFNEYSRILTTYAKIAEAKGVPYISLGHGLNYATSPSKFSSTNLYHSLWTKLIQDIKEVYSGQIIYFGTNRPFDALNYEGGTEIEYYEDSGYTTTFKNLFDMFGIIISNITTTQNPNISEIKKSVTDILSRYEDFDKPIILWIWAPSVDGAANRYGHLEPVIDVSSASSNFEVDFYEQADIYEGIFEAVNESNVNISGIISHGYMYYNNFKKYEPRNMQTAFEKAASTRNKPAEEIIKYWFEKL